MIPGSNCNQEISEGSQVPSIWNETSVDYSLNKTLHELFEEQVVKTPYSIALSFRDQHLTYEQLNIYANQLAHYLRSQGVRAESVVGVYFERSFEMVISLIAILKAGGAYIPIDPEYPDERISFIIDDSCPSIILTHQKFISKIPEGKNKFEYNKDDYLLSNLSKSNLVPCSGPENAAYIIYTSGSTGTPKGVINIHCGIVNRLLWMQDCFSLTDEDRVLQKTPYSFDVSVWEFFWPLITGAQLVIAEPGGHRDTNYIVNIIKTSAITTIHFVPSMLRLFLESKKLEMLKSLKRVICSGEALPYVLQERFFERFSCSLYNLYGPTEASVDVTWWKCCRNDSRKIVPIGKPISNIQLYILDESMMHVPVGTAGELYIGGIGVARGYINREKLTKERFLNDQFSKKPGAKLYKTGDICRYLSDGAIEYLGRIDNQVKIRGFRIETGEIESVILTYKTIRAVAVIAKGDILAGDIRLIAYIVTEGDSIPVDDLRNYLASRLPDYMIPSQFVKLDVLPTTQSGKIDRLALPEPNAVRPYLRQDYIEPSTETEKKVASIWITELKIEKVGVRDNFFDLGGNSILASSIAAKMEGIFNLAIPVVKIFQNPSVASIANYIDSKYKGNEFNNQIVAGNRKRSRSSTTNVAVIGFSGRFPGAATIDQLWYNLCQGVESITHFSDDELDPHIENWLRNNPDYVKARGIISDADKFDAAFFGISPAEARIMCPQQRIFLEIAWAALENAGHCPDNYQGKIGVFAGMGDNYYYPYNVLSNPEIVRSVGKFVASYGNEKDYIATRVSYQLNLTGPGISLNTGCSTSLTAVDLAYNSIINAECDIALAGGVDIAIPQKSGQLFQEGGVFCKDGHCKPFDANSTGTMFCDGAGIIVLRKLEDAIADGDTIYAVITGCAKNNDGSQKVSFLAPSVNGQAEVITLAQSSANTSPDEISYIEAHGTGTQLGDPIEIEALTKAFRATTQRKQFCRIGSIKGNIGHPSIASGIAGVIKTSLCLYHEKIPGTLHYEKPNPKIDFENSPFYVTDKLSTWHREDKPRKAGVSAFGFGGTNVHIILEEAPLPVKGSKSRNNHLLLLSAKSCKALENKLDDFENYCKSQEEINLDDVCFTLACGRTHFNNRAFFVFSSKEDLLEQIATVKCSNYYYKTIETRNPKICFMFPGQGSQYLNMGLSLYNSEFVYKKEVDTCAEILRKFIEKDIRKFMFQDEMKSDMPVSASYETQLTQPALFITSYAIAKLFKSWGIEQSVMIGHSIGEFVCACLSGVISLEDALFVIAQSSILTQQIPIGSMLSVAKQEDQLQNFITDKVTIASINGPSLSVMAGPTEDIEALKSELDQSGILCKYLNSTHAFHSPMMDQVISPLNEIIKNIKLNKPKIPFVSTISGTWITDAEATDSYYWASHIRKVVKFADGIKVLLRDPSLVLIETGPGASLSVLAKQQSLDIKKQTILPSMSDSGNSEKEISSLLNTIGQLWLNGVEFDWNAFYAFEKRHRIPLPTYPFEKKRYWLDPPEIIKSSSKKAVLYTTIAAEDGKSVTGNAKNLLLNMEPTEIHKAISKLFSELTERDLSEFGCDVNFFDMGMDSLFLTQIAFKLKEIFGVSLSFGQLSENFSTINKLVGWLQQHSPKITSPNESSNNS